MAEGARLESVYTATYPGFESPPHRHILRRARTKVRAFFSHVVQVPSAPLTPALSQGAREKTSAELNSEHIRSPLLWGEG